MLQPAGQTHPAVASAGNEPTEVRMVRVGRTPRPAPHPRRARCALLDSLRVAARDALGLWLQTFQWDSFATFTWADKALDRPTLAIDRVARFLKGKEVPEWIAVFLAAERHYLGGAHVHGLLLYAPTWRKTHLETWQSWRKRYGSFARIETPRSGLAVTTYCAKYLTKTFEPEWTILGTPVKV